MTIRRYINIIENAATLMEMLVSPPQWRNMDQGVVIAYRENIWIVTSENFEELCDAICEKIGLNPDGVVDEYDLINQISENRPDVFHAQMRNHTLSLDHYMRLSPESSVLLKKVYATLGIKNVFQDKLTMSGDEDTFKYDVSKNKGRIPEIVFHGTNTRYITSILKAGLTPNNNNSNWKKTIGKFKNRVYFSANLPDAIYHANRQAKEFNSTPLVIATKIPDRSLISLDYDVATDFYGDDHPALDREGYTDAFRRTTYGYATGKTVQQAGAKTDFTRETGVFAYKGRVPASFFQYIIFPIGDGELTSEYKTIPPTFAALGKAMDQREYGEDYEPEEWEDEEDDK